MNDIKKLLDEAREEIRKAKGYKTEHDFYDPYVNSAIIRRKETEAFRDGFNSNKEIVVELVEVLEFYSFAPASEKLLEVAPKFREPAKQALAKVEARLRGNK